MWGTHSTRGMKLFPAGPRNICGEAAAVRDTETQSERRMKLYTDEGAKGEQNKASVAPQSITLSPGEGRLQFSSISK